MSLAKHGRGKIPILLSVRIEKNIPSLDESPRCSFKTWTAMALVAAVDPTTVFSDLLSGNITQVIAYILQVRRTEYRLSHI